MNHGPTLVDNNVLIGQATRSNSEATVFAHNLFVDCVTITTPTPSVGRATTSRTRQRRSGKRRAPPRTNLVQQHLRPAWARRGENGPGLLSDHNVFLEGARKARSATRTAWSRPMSRSCRQGPSPGAAITFSVGDAPPCLKGRGSTPKLVGVFPTVGQTIEDRYGNPITVDTDIGGKPFLRPVPGPLAGLRRGENTITWRQSAN